MAPGMDLVFRFDHFFPGSADMDRPGQRARFICPWDWAIQGPIDLEDRRPDLPPRQPPPVSRADTVAADSNRRPRHHVQHHRVAGRKLVEELTMRPVSMLPPPSTMILASASAMRWDPPRAIGHP